LRKLQDSNSWDEAKRLFEGAVALDPAQRARYLDQNSAGNRKLRVEVEALLKQHEAAGSFMGEPLMDLESLASPHEIVPGTRVKDRYRIERKLSQGGFGVVYLAYDENLYDKKVVVKVLLAVDGEEARWIEGKFREEVRALSLIDHPGVVVVYDSGVLRDGRPFFVMKYVEGQSLQALLKEDGMAPQQVGRIAEQIGQALGAAHDKGVWHRDLKPSNIMVQLDPGGTPKVCLIDFGIATINDRPSSLTTRIVGTFSYMAPEQLEGKINCATDLYAFGIIVYEMLTGRKPFSALDPITLRKQQQSGVRIDLSSKHPSVMMEVERLVRSALSFRPEDRPSSASRFGSQLARSLVVTPSARRRRPFVIPLAAAIAISVGGGAVWMHRHAAAAALAAATPPAPNSLPSNSAAPDFANRVSTELSLSLLVQPMRNGRPVGHSSILPAGAALHPSEAFTLLIQSSNAGHIYLLSEENESDTLNVLYPASFMYGGSSELGAGEVKQIPEGSRFRVDVKNAQEALWLVWSRDLLKEFESLKRWTNPSDRGAIKDTAERSRVRAFLHDSVRSQKASGRTSGTQMGITGYNSQVIWKIPLRVESETRK
jgi:serine/threonine protein kinase